MKPVQRTFAIVALTTTLVSCGVRNPPATTPILTMTPPRISVTTATYPLLSDIVKAYGDHSSAYVFDLSPANIQMRLDELQNERTQYVITHHIPIGSSLWAAPIAQDGLAIIVHPNSPLNNLSLDQLRQIYNGKLTTIIHDGVGHDFIVFSREEGSDIRAELERMIMGNRRITANARLAFSDDQMIRLVSQTDGAIGYVSWGFLNSASDAEVGVLQINRVSPTLMTIYEHVYPLTNTIYIVGKSEPQDDVRGLIGWIQSQAGQKAVMLHYVPLLMPKSSSEN